MFEIKSDDDFKVHWKPLAIVLGIFWIMYFSFVEDLTTHIFYFSMASGFIGVIVNETTSWFTNKSLKEK